MTRRGAGVYVGYSDRTPDGPQRPADGLRLEPKGSPVLRRNTKDERLAARWTCARNATDAADLRLLFEALDLGGDL